MGNSRYWAVDETFARQEGSPVQYEPYEETFALQAEDAVDDIHTVTETREAEPAVFVSLC